MFAKTFRRAVIALTLLALSGCKLPIGPGSIPGLPADASSLLGTWTSGGGGTDSCTDFKWEITSQTATSATGKISATCLGTIPVSANASAQLNGQTLNITMTGSGTLSGPTTCDFSVSGVATLENGDTIRMPFSGTTCLGPVSGTVVLHKAPPPAPPAPPPPSSPPPAPDPPPPPPPPGPEPWESCSAFVSDKPDLVDCVHNAIQPGSSGAKAFEVTKRVAWLLRGEGAGLLIKNGGDNIISWQGYSFSISRICYPDGHIYKVIGDAGDGGANLASWQENGFVDPALYVPAINPKTGG